MRLPRTFPWLLPGAGEPEPEPGPERVQGPEQAVQLERVPVQAPGLARRQVRALEQEQERLPWELRLPRHIRQRR